MVFVLYTCRNIKPFKRVEYNINMDCIQNLYFYIALLFDRFASVTLGSRAMAIVF